MLNTASWYSPQANQRLNLVEESQLYSSFHIYNQEHDEEGESSTRINLKWVSLQRAQAIFQLSYILIAPQRDEKSSSWLCSEYGGVSQGSRSVEDQRSLDST